jgi:hypothetical protein
MPMPSGKSSRVLLAVALGVGLAPAGPARADIKLLARARIPADATDKSGLTDTLSDGTPHNRLGSCGSAIAYTGSGHRYVLLSDRGPKDGTTRYQCRFHLFDIRPGKGDTTLKVSLLDTKILKDESGRPFVGLSSAIDADRPARSLRLDPEGVRVGPAGALFVSDEYGPFLYEFDGEGRRRRAFPVPARFLVARPHGDPKTELALNKTGRVPNRGMEGLAISPDGRKLYGCMQGPLIQDGGRAGTNVRILELDTRTNATREFLYPLEGSHTGVSEILAVNDREFLVLERTGKSSKPVTRIYKIDISRASDITGRDALPKKGVPAGVVPVAKTLFLDLRHPRFGLAGPDFPVKVEGLAFGPDLPDGRRLLLVSSDNDIAGEPTHLFAFAIDRADLPNFKGQTWAP